MGEDYPPHRAELSLDGSESKPPSVNRWNFLSVFLGFLVTALVFLLSSGDALTGPASSSQVLGMARKSSKGQAVPTLHVVGDSTCAINGMSLIDDALDYVDPCAKGLNIGGPTRKAIRACVLSTALIRLQYRWLVYVKPSARDIG